MPMLYDHEHCETKVLVGQERGYLVKTLCIVK